MSLYKIIPAQSDDLRLLAQIQIRAEANVPIGRARFLHTPPSVLESYFLSHLQSSFSSPTKQVLKAVQEDGVITALGVWVLPGDDGDKKARELGMRETEAEKRGRYEEMLPPGANVDLAVELWGRSYCHEEGRYYRLRNVFTDPAHQGKGAATAITAWGTQKADAEGLMCYIYSSDVAKKIYQKAGFVEYEPPAVYEGSSRFAMRRTPRPPP